MFRMVFIFVFFFAVQEQRTVQIEQTLKKISPKVDSVMSKFIRAKGGESALNKIKDYAIKGDVVAGGSVVGTFEIFSCRRSASYD